MTEFAQPYLYAIPYRNKYLVYRPLKRLAFIANSALVNLISDKEMNPALPLLGENKAVESFLDGIRFWEPDSVVPPTFCLDTYKPTTAVLFLTTACNFRCTYCYASGGETKEHSLPFELGCRAIDIVRRNALELGEDHFTLGFHGGGEPTLYDEIFKKLVLYARTRDLPCKITVATNGYWTDDYRAWILRHLHEISLSFDGIRPVQNRQRPLASGRDSFDGVMRTIREMDRQAFPYGLRMTITDDAIDMLAESVTFICEETRCVSIQVEPVFDHGRARKTGCGTIDNDRFASAFLDAYDIAVSYGRHMYYSGARPWVLTERFCRAPENALVVGADGVITACYEIHGKAHPLSQYFFHGRLFLDGRLETDESDRRMFFNRIEERRSLCSGCFCFWHCAGDCPSKTFTEQKGGHLVFGKRCDLNRLITKELLARYISSGNGVWRGEMDRALIVP